MRPFKFFFGVAVAAIVFMFMIKVFIAAFFIAAIMSVIFFIAQKIRNFFMGITWHGQGGHYAYDYAYENNHHNRHRPQAFDKEQDAFANFWEQKMKQHFVVKIK